MTLSLSGPNLVIRLITALACGLLLQSCQQETESRSDQIVIHAGSPNGSYSQLVDLLNERVQALKDADCELFSNGCPPITQFDFDTACEDGGSKENLQRLGMRLAPDNEKENVSFRPCKKNGVDRLSEDNDFAIVQNYFIAAAAQTSCNIENCKDFYAQQLDGERYQKFEDLRIVLPLYNGFIQIVSAHKKPGPGETPDQVELEELENGIVYFQGVNSKYGNDVLSRHPALLNKFPSIINRDDFNQDTFGQLKEKVGHRVHLQDLPPEQWQALWDFLKDAGNESERNNRLLACGVIDAFAISGEIIEDGKEFSYNVPALSGGSLSRCNEEYRQQQIQIPEVIIDGLVKDHPYYTKLEPPTAWVNTPITSIPGVVTYLVTTAKADEVLVNRLTDALHDDWANLMLLREELTPIEENALKKPAPYHIGAEVALNNEGLLSAGFTFETIIEFGLFLVFLTLMNRYWRSKLGYDRLGEKQGYGFAYMFTHGFADMVLIVLWWMFFFMFVVTTIRYSDALIASTQNSDDQLSGLSFSATLIWMFTFISSGYEDNVFPTSDFARIVVSSFAIAGVAYPLYLIARTWDRIRTQRLTRARGGEFRSMWRIIKDWFLELLPWTYRSKGTLLLCGWNNRAPGLIYNLTCPESPFDGVVNILADPEIEYPISQYGFNKKRVRFYRGDSSQRINLERAEVMRADTALILSDESAGLANSSGVLTALAIERIKPEVVVCAEMTMSSGSRDFTEQHIDSVFDPALISRQMLILGCFDNYVLDFALDALSPDEHYEWYARKTKTLRLLLPSTEHPETVGELNNSLQLLGISIVGICEDNNSGAEGGVLSKDFRKDTYLDPLMSVDAMQRRLNDDDYIICAAESPDCFKNTDMRRSEINHGDLASVEQSDIKIIKNRRASASVLIIGHQHQAVAISEQIQETIGSSAMIVTGEIKTETIATDQLFGEELNQTISSSLVEKDWTHILLLSSIPVNRSPGQFDRLAAAADSDTIMRANFIRVELNRLNKNPIIVAEANKTHNRQLAKDADVTTVVPSSLLIERLLARMVSAGGRVPELLSAMLSLQGNTLLKSVKLQAGHPLIGHDYDKVLNTWYADGRVMGILPKGALSRLDSFRNVSDDFDWHFVMSPPLTETQPQLLEKDVIIVLANGNLA